MMGNLFNKNRFIGTKRNKISGSMRADTKLLASRNQEKKQAADDSLLIIESNTVYEIDGVCMELIKRGLE